MAKRLVFGSELPASCKEALARINPQLPRVRWGRTGQLHLTLSFLGEVSAEAEGRLRETFVDVRVARSSSRSAVSAPLAG